jgi:hypothetical protein
MDKKTETKVEKSSFELKIEGKISRIMDCIYYELGDHRLIGGSQIHTTLVGQLNKEKWEEIRHKVAELFEKEKPCNNATIFFVICGFLETFVRDVFKHLENERVKK